MGKKTPPCPLYDQWTQARFKSFLSSAIRQASQRWPPSQEVMKKFRRPYTGEDKRTKWEYPCVACKGWFKAKEIKRDHIDPVRGFSDDFNKWPEEFGQLAEKLFCSIEGYQLLCSSCHTKKSNIERETNQWTRK